MQILAGDGSVDVLIIRAHTHLDFWPALWTISAQVIKIGAPCATLSNISRQKENNEFNTKNQETKLFR